MIYATPTTLLNGTPVLDVTVSSTCREPWRTARGTGMNIAGPVTIQAGFGTDLQEIFHGITENPGRAATGRAEFTARGLPEWRKEIAGQGFDTPHLETVLNWIAAQCGGKLHLNTSGPVRNSLLITRGPAHQVIREVLQAWGDTSTLLELDGGVLYVGPEAQSPHAAAPIYFLKRFENIFKFELTGPDRCRVTTMLTPQLRVGHRVELDHPAFSGTFRVAEIRHSTKTLHTTLELKI